MKIATSGIYIHDFKDGWAVQYEDRIDAIYYRRGKRKYNYRELARVFDGTPRFDTLDEAVIYSGGLLDRLEKRGLPVDECVVVV